MFGISINMSAEYFTKSYMCMYMYMPDTCSFSYDSVTLVALVASRMLFGFCSRIHQAAKSKLVSLRCIRVSFVFSTIFLLVFHIPYMPFLPVSFLMLQWSDSCVLLEQDRQRWSTIDLICAPSLAHSHPTNVALDNGRRIIVDDGNCSFKT